MKIIVLFIVYMSGSTIHAQACRNGWVRHNDSCYLFSKTPVDWPDALVICKAFDARLVEIETATEDHYVKETLKSIHLHDSSPPYGYWIGFNDIEVADEYRWVSLDKPMAYHSWYPGEPNAHSDQNCGVLWTAFKFEWGDYYCKDDHLFFICEKDLHDFEGISLRIKPEDSEWVVKTESRMECC